MNDHKETHQGQQNQESDKHNQLDPNKKPNPANQNEQKRREEEEKRKKEHHQSQPEHRARTSSGGSGS